jgi:hypothetical protein
VALKPWVAWRTSWSSQPTWRAFSMGRGGQDVATMEDKGIGRTQLCLDMALFVFGEWSGKMGILIS